MKTDSDAFAVIPNTPRNRHARRAAGAAGTSFYISRGLPFTTMRQYREKRRDRDSQNAVELSRELTRLAECFPRFKLALNQLQHFVLVQVRSPQWKQHRVIDCLSARHVVSVRELLKTSGLDFVSLNGTLVDLRSEGRVITCNRAGEPLTVRDVEHTAKIYWRLKQ